MTKNRPRTTPVKVLHVTNDLAVGGSEVMLHRLLAETDRERFDPVVLSLAGGGALYGAVEALNIPVLSARMRAPLPSASSVGRLIREARAVKPDLIQGWMYHGSLAAQFVRTLSRPRARVIWGIRNSISRPSREKRMTDAVIRLGALASRLPDGIIYVSNANRSEHEALGYFNRNNYVVPNGFDTSLFAPSVRTRSLVRAELGVPEGVVLVGLIARFHPSKDHANFLRAAALLLRDCRNVRFLLCGSGVDSGNLSINRLAAELCISDKLLLLGERHDVPRLMTALDLLSSSSSNESFHNVIGEAMSSGLPCVATAVGGVPWLLGDTGILTPPRDPEALAQGLKRLIMMGREGRMLLGSEARRRIVENFSLQSVARQYESIYMKTVGRALESD
ncbi:MAG: glycosyltransferase [Acidobacteriota bacterium]|nr:glycosyltransferase [Acidobacteriota bacterium]